MAYASAYAPVRRTEGRHAAIGAPACPLPNPVVPNTGPTCAGSERERDVENLRADLQRYVNDIKQARGRYLPGRLAGARDGMLRVAHACAVEQLPAADIVSPLWPPVPRSKDLAKQSARLDVHGHVIALKIWAGAVVSVCRGNQLLQESRQDLCRDTEDALVSAIASRRGVTGFDRWRLRAARASVVCARCRAAKTGA